MKSILQRSSEALVHKRDLLLQLEFLQGQWGERKNPFFFTNIYKLYLLRNSLSRKLYFPKELIDMYVRNVSEQECDNILVRDSTGWSEFIG